MGDIVPNSCSSSFGAIAPQTILVADDDPDLLALMTRRLTKAGYLVVTASDGQQALEQAATLRPDLALIDVMMPKMNGLEVVARLRAEPSTSAIKIIMVSAGNYAAKFLHESGADSYVVKPFDRNEPVGQVRSVLADVTAPFESARTVLRATRPVRAS